MNTINKVEIGTLVSPIRTWNPREASNPRAFNYIDISSIDREKKEITEPKEVLTHDAPSRARQLVKSNDILVSTVRPNLNGVAMVPPELDGATASTGYCVLRSKPERLDARYLYYWVRSLQFVADMERMATGASYPAVSDAIVKASRIPLPPLPVQRRIAAVLDKADALRRKRRRALDRLDDLLQAVFLDMFGDPVTNPKRWPSSTLDEIGKVQGGLQLSSKRASYPLELPYLRVANVYRDRLSLSEIKKISLTQAELDRVRLQRGDILIVEGHGNPTEIGRSAIWDGSIDPCVHQNHLIRVRLNTTIALPEYVSAFLNSPGGRRQMFKHGKTTSGLNTISTSNVKATNISVPPLQIQKEYLLALKRVTNLREQHLRIASTTEMLFNALMQKAFTGALDFAEDVIDDAERTRGEPATQLSLFE